jgi:hypothetical protein
VSVSREVPQSALLNETPEKADDKAYAITGNQSAPTRIDGGNITLPRDRRARIYRASVIIVPAARRNVFVAPNGIAVDGIKMNKERTSDAKRANMLIVSRERRVVLIVCCGGMVNSVYYI